MGYTTGSLSSIGSGTEVVSSTAFVRSSLWIWMCSLSFARTLWAKEGLWKIAAIRPVIVFLGGSYPERTAECRSDHPLPSLELVTHNDTRLQPNRSLSHTKQKRPHSSRIPTRVTSCSRGRMGCWEFTGDLLRGTLPLPGDLSALFVFSLSFAIFIFLFFPTSHSSSRLSSSLPLELRGLI